MLNYLSPAPPEEKLTPKDTKILLPLFALENLLFLTFYLTTKGLIRQNRSKDKNPDPTNFVSFPVYGVDKFIYCVTSVM